MARTKNNNKASLETSLNFIEDSNDNYYSVKNKASDKSLTKDKKYYLVCEVMARRSVYGANGKVLTFDENGETEIITDDLKVFENIPCYKVVSK